MDIASRLVLLLFLMSAVAQVYTLYSVGEKRAAGLHPWNGFLTNTNQLHRRQTYSENPINWEQIWKLKALLDQVGRRK